MKYLALIFALVLPPGCAAWKPTEFESGGKAVKPGSWHWLSNAKMGGDKTDPGGYGGGSTGDGGGRSSITRPARKSG